MQQLTPFPALKLQIKSAATKHLFLIMLHFSLTRYTVRANRRLITGLVYSSPRERRLFFIQPLMRSNYSTACHFFRCMLFKSRRYYRHICVLVTSG